MSVSTPPEFVVAFVFGPPCSGKTAVARRVASQAYFDYECPSDWLRVVRDSGEASAPLGRYTSCNYTFDTLDPLVTAHVFEAVASSQRLGAQGIVVDGFPRTQHQAHALLERLRPVAWRPLRLHLLHLTGVSLELSVYRSMTRQWVPAASHLVEVSDEYPHHHNLTEQEATKRYLVYESHARDMLRVLDAAATGTISLDAVTRTESQVATIALSLVRGGAEDGYGRVVAPDGIMVGGTEASPVDNALVTQACMDLVGLGDQRLRRRFVGSHPVSLQRVHLKSLESHPYLVSRKLDGDRVLLFFHGPASLWALKRNFDVHHHAIACDVNYSGTLLDAELLITGGGGISYCIIDALAFRGELLIRRPLLQRLEAVRALCPLLARILVARDVFLQRYYAMPDLRMIASGGSSGMLPHDPRFRTDGLVFTPQELPYRLGRDKNAYKWKPCDSNTADLMVLSLPPVSDGRIGLGVRKTYEEEEVADGSGATTTVSTSSDDSPQLVPVGHLVVPDELRPNAAALRLGSIVECTPTPGGRGRVWTFQRHRQDKSEPNAEWVFTRIVESIEENITLRELCALPGIR
jgi:adenylate kinase family enzyme